ncbi:uncharacterized protein STEHIDRAFT_162411 [Stereum hirsutum FP-91666 SS1]|uniref:uncharacterized protein n=1 Tax=Stereum hirsutum (strain FP-91666) TaxID=721885 RepID=UPI000444A925|nr:uncharacterized protein STEHIDRAFT_162411 [Stereum hirsutum FP-91666 SS1]EIM80629.1 hypothetical protein STEHIDRAFT_162411 [Stereum hirsutum FP-91666 SS1]
MPLGQALLLSPYATFMNSLEAYLAPRQSLKESSYLDTFIGIFNHYPASDSKSLENPTQLQPSPEQPQPTQSSSEHPDVTPEFSITPFPSRKPLSSPYLSPLMVQAQPSLPRIDLSLELRKLSAHNLREHKHALLSLSHSKHHSKRHSRSYPLSPPSSSSSSSSSSASTAYDTPYYDSGHAYDTWFDTIPLQLGLRLRLHLRLPHAQAPRLVLAILCVFVLALMGQLVLVWMMTREWGVFAS